MAYTATVLKLKNVRPHSNADKVQLATCHGCQVVVGLDAKEGDLGVFFPSDGQLSHEFCSVNNLYRNVELNNVKDARPGMFDENRRVRAQKFRGEISDGFWVPISNFDFIFGAVLNENDEFDAINGIPICNKYVNKATKIASEGKTKKAKSSRSSIMFKEHFDTGHFGKNLHAIGMDDVLVITEKVHGTSGRIGNVKLSRTLNWKEKLAKRFGIKLDETKWDYLNGTRRVVLAESSGNQFHDATIRDKAMDLFKDNLRKGETVYFEIVGFESTGRPIMGSVPTAKLGDKEFTKTYGDIMTYSYGCAVGDCAIYVYRITYNDEDGHTYEYSFNDVMKRCNELGVNFAPYIQTTSMRLLSILFDTNDEEFLRNKLLEVVDEFAQGPSILDGNHIREGVCVKIEGGQTFKHKSFNFKVLEGIVKDSGVIDEEESEG